MAVCAGPCYKIIIIGNIGVGKTTLFHRVLFGKYDDDFRSTIGFDCFEKTVTVHGESIRIDLNDCQGRERFRTRNISNLYHRASAAILVYSMDNSDSFDDLHVWVEECRENLWGNLGHELLWAVVGNKSDLLCEVSSDRVEEFCENLGTTLKFEVSAKTGDNVEKMFGKVAETVHDHRSRIYSKEHKDSLQINNTRSTSSSTCIC